MRRIKFIISLCNMGGGLFDNNTLIWGPYKQLIIFYTADELQNAKVQYLKELVETIKEDIDMLCLDDWAYDALTYDHIFVNHKKSLYRIKENKKIIDLYKDFSEDDIELHYIVVCGGASLELRGFKFIVHTDEKIHKYMPHIHVKKDEYSARYSLETIEMIDANSKTAKLFFKRSEKKIIIPFIKENFYWFMENWNLCQKGYEPPEINEKGMQYPKMW